MYKIKELKDRNEEKIYVYRFRGDNGLLVEYSHGRMDWVSVDSRTYINIDNYEWWRPA